MDYFKKITSLIVLIAFTTLGVAQAVSTQNDNDDRATQWQIDKAHSGINFTINHFFTPVDGTFDDVEANIVFDPENL
ncbi:MAG: YceI family protein, partial [Balneolaceae bacterium]